MKQKGKSGEMGNPRWFCENLEIEAKNVKSKEEWRQSNTQLSYLFVLQWFAWNYEITKLLKRLQKSPKKVTKKTKDAKIKRWNKEQKMEENQKELKT